MAPSAKKHRNSTKRTPRTMREDDNIPDAPPLQRSKTPVHHDENTLWEAGVPSQISIATKRKGWSETKLWEIMGYTSAEGSRFKKEFLKSWVIEKHPEVAGGPERIAYWHPRSDEVWQRAISDFIEDFKMQLPIDQFQNDNRIRRHWVHLWLIQCGNKLRTDLTGNKKKIATAPESPEPSQLASLPYTSFIVLLRHNSLANPLPSIAYPNVAAWDDLTKWLYRHMASNDFTYEVRFKVRVSDEEVLESFPSYKTGQEVVVPICSQEEYNTALLLWHSLSSTSASPKSLQIYAVEKSKKRKKLKNTESDIDSDSDYEPSQKRTREQDMARNGKKTEEGSKGKGKQKSSSEEDTWFESEFQNLSRSPSIALSVGSSPEGTPWSIQQTPEEVIPVDVWQRILDSLGMKVNRNERHFLEMFGGEKDPPAHDGGQWQRLLANHANAYEHECFDDALKYLDAKPAPRINGEVPGGPKWILPGIPNGRFMMHQVWAVWFVIKRWLWESSLPGVLIADEMGLGKTWTAIGAAMTSKIIYEQAMRGDIPMAIFNGLTYKEQLVQATLDIDNTDSRWIKDPRCTYPYLPPPLDPKYSKCDPRQPILVVTLSNVSHTFTTALERLAANTKFRLRVLNGKDYQHSRASDLNFDTAYPERRWDIHLVNYETLLSRSKIGGKQQLNGCHWSFAIFDESHKVKNPRAETFQLFERLSCSFKLQVTGTPAFHGLKDWLYQTQWLFSGAHKTSTSYKQHGPEAMADAIQRLDNTTQSQDAGEAAYASRMVIEVTSPWCIRRWADMRTSDGKRLIPQFDVAVTNVNTRWTEEEQNLHAVKVKKLADSKLAVMSKIHRWRLYCFSQRLGNTGDKNSNGEWFEEWGSNGQLRYYHDSPVFRWFRYSLVPLLLGQPGAPRLPPPPSLSDTAELHNTTAASTFRIPNKVVIFCGLPGQVRHTFWWFKTFFPDFPTFTLLMGSTAEERSDAQQQFADIQEPAIMITTPQIGGFGLNLVAANHVVVSQKVWAVNEQRQAIGRIVRLGQMRQPYAWILHTGPGGFDDRAKELQMQGGIREMRVLHGLMNHPQITFEMVNDAFKARGIRFPDDANDYNSIGCSE
ncbi:SNF2 family N-terminal domain-containing protein [Trichophaea hybrida]|nr:SNF2 family N-terminal domain-containing protein [Trichophaea hybrida]